MKYAHVTITQKMPVTIVTTMKKVILLPEDLPADPEVINEYVTDWVHCHELDCDLFKEPVTTNLHSQIVPNEDEGNDVWVWVDEVEGDV